MWTVCYKPASVSRFDKFMNVCSVQFSSVAQSCPTLCDPMNCSTPGLPVQHQLLEFTQTHVHWVSDAIQPSHPLLSPSPPALSFSQHQGLFKWLSTLHQVAKVLEFQLQRQHQWTPRTDLYIQACSIASELSQRFATLWTVACQVPLSMGFSRQEY